jgi:hypothetical protein
MCNLHIEKVKQGVGRKKIENLSANHTLHTFLKKPAGGFER